MPVELLLALLLSGPAPDRKAELARQVRQLDLLRASCAALETEVEQRGEAIDRLDRSGQDARARALLRETHAAMEALTDCRRRQKAMEREVRDLGLEIRKETEAAMDRALAAGGPRQEVYERIRPLLETLRILPAPAGCPLADFEEVEFSERDPAPILEEKRLLVEDILRRLALLAQDNDARLRDLQSERDLRRHLSQFMTGLEVEGGSGMSDFRPSEDENRQRLREVEEEIAQCERARKVGETQVIHWRERAAALDRLSGGL
jgi:hypothetical protein